MIKHCIQALKCLVLELLVECVSATERGQPLYKARTKGPLPICPPFGGMLLHKTRSVCVSVYTIALISASYNAAIGPILKY